MKTFKQFLADLDDGVSETEATRRYADYKSDFKKDLIHAFFKAHKDEEW